jgi:hypothetical protein
MDLQSKVFSKIAVICIFTLMRKHGNKPSAFSAGPVIQSGVKAILLLLIAAVFFAKTSYSQTAYVKKYLPVAEHLEEDYGIPVAVILGVAILESGSGTSRKSKISTRF